MWLVTCKWVIFWDTLWDNMCVAACCMCASVIITKRCWPENLKVEFKEITTQHSITKTKNKTVHTDGEKTSGRGKRQTTRKPISRQAYKRTNTFMFWRTETYEGTSRLCRAGFSLHTSGPTDWHTAPLLSRRSNPSAYGRRPHRASLSSCGALTPCPVPSAHMHHLQKDTESRRVRQTLKNYNSKTHLEIKRNVLQLLEFFLTI